MATAVYNYEVNTAGFYDDVYKFCTECATFEDRDFAKIHCECCGHKLEFITVPYSIKNWLHDNRPVVIPPPPVLTRQVAGSFDDLDIAPPGPFTRQIAAPDMDMPPLRFVDPDSLPDEEYEDMPAETNWVEYWDYERATAENPVVSTFMEIVEVKQSVLPPCSCPDCCDDAMDEQMDWDHDYPMSDVEPDVATEVQDSWMGDDGDDYDYEECDSIS